MTDRKPLSERAKMRLRWARKLLQNNPPFWGLEPDWKLDDAGGVYEAIEAVIASLAEPTREKLRGHVDWVEDYERAEAEQAANAPTHRPLRQKD